MLLSKPMEIKITCGSCDTKFAFDVEPIHGRMPAPVNCPECGLEATEQANAEIQSSLAASSPGHPAPAPAAIPALACGCAGNTTATRIASVGRAIADQSAGCAAAVDRQRRS
jgi:transcription elongation factor Elf1